MAETQYLRTVPLRSFGLGWFGATALLLTLLLGCGITDKQDPEQTYPPRRQRRDSPPEVTEPRGVVFMAGGSGGFRGAPLCLRFALADLQVPLEVEEVPWSHGYGRVLADQIDWPHICAEGAKLAERVRAQIKKQPGRPVYLCGYSAGCGVVLTATAQLPADSVEQILLLSPSVSAEYDVRPALLASRQGVDVFYSRLDLLVLGMCMRVVGTVDRQWCSAAGRIGFQCPCDDPADSIYLKLRQHPWHFNYVGEGHWGGHFGVADRCFLRAHVVPLLAASLREQGPRREPASGGRGPSE